MMPDREKAIEWADKCTSPAHEAEDCNGCPYHLNHEGFYSCIECLMGDIVVLLKEQEKEGKWERQYSRPGVYANLFWWCSYCKRPTQYQNAGIFYEYCPHCGAKMEKATDD